MQLTSVDVNTIIIDRIINSAGFTEFITQYNVLITAMLSFVTLTVLVLFFANVVRYSHASDNDAARHMAMNGILVCLICLACIGGIDTLYAIVASLIFGM